MKLIHTADVHLDTSYVWAARPGIIHDTGFGRRRRKALRTVFQDTMRRASEWPADAVLIAGDLFDLARLQWDTVTFLREMFELVQPIPVFIAPGASDPCTPESPYVCESWPANVHIFQAPTWSAVTLADLGAMVHGMGFDAPRPSRDPFQEGLAVASDGLLHLGLAHGAELGHLAPGVDAAMPFHAKALAGSGLDYLALGHYHEITPLTSHTGTPMHYPGAPEGHDFNTPGMHYFLEVEVEAGSAPVVRPAASSRTLFENLDIDCTGLAAVSELTERLAAANDGDRARAIHVTFTGAPPGGMEGLLREALAEAPWDLELFSWSDQTDAGEVLAALARQSTSLGAFAERMIREMADAPDEARRRALRRACDVGIAAYRGEVLPLPDLRAEGGSAP